MAYNHRYRGTPRSRAHTSTVTEPGRAGESVGTRAYKHHHKGGTDIGTTRATRGYRGVPPRHWVAHCPCLRGEFREAAPSATVLAATCARTPPSRRAPITRHLVADAQEAPPSPAMGGDPKPASEYRRSGKRTAWTLFTGGQPPSSTPKRGDAKPALKINGPDNGPRVNHTKGGTPLVNSEKG